MKTQVTLYLENMSLREGKKRAIDLDFKFSEYFQKILDIELANKFLDKITEKEQS